MSLVICIVSIGRRKGKTGLVERLVKRFVSDGLRVATVKHISSHFDTSKKDTWKHLEAGATITVASTPKEIVSIIRSKKPSLENALENIHVPNELTLVEGYKNSPYPKILCADTADDAKLGIKEISNIIMISGSIVNRKEEIEKFETEFSEPPVYDLDDMVSAVKDMLVNSIVKSLPGLNCKKCGYDSCLDLAEATLRGEASIEECKVLKMDIVNLKVDGSTIPIGEFPQRIIHNITLGILESLKGVEKHPQSVEITVKANLEVTANRK